MWGLNVIDVGRARIPLLQSRVREIVFAKGLVLAWRMQIVLVSVEECSCVEGVPTVRRWVVRCRGWVRRSCDRQLTGCNVSLCWLVASEELEEEVAHDHVRVLWTLVSPWALKTSFTINFSLHIVFVAALELRDSPRAGWHFACAAFYAYSWKHTSPVHANHACPLSLHTCNICLPKIVILSFLF